MPDNEKVFVEEGYRFTVGTDPDNGSKWVADIYLPETEGCNAEWARVVGLFPSEREAITAAKYEIGKLTGQS